MDKTQKVEQVRTIRRGNYYVTTGYFTPKIHGKYTAYFFNAMQDDKTKEEWEGLGFYKFEVKENPNIAVSLSPNTAYMKAGEEIYLSVTYLSPELPTQHIAWNEKKTGCPQAFIGLERRPAKQIAEN
ncbi:hypothetical protein [Brevibacillus choshinensis]|uniref:hypothetical protein n=1 Tax=Brevibacillus choshinensis TaxID=54911 RepID=UPI0006EBFF43|nr:hypothetical protein [Brevibacillus choshinensis]